MTSRYYYNLKELILPESAGVVGWQRLFSRFVISYTSNDITKALFNHLIESSYFESIVYIDIEHPYYEATTRPTINQLIVDHLEEVQEFLLKIKNWLEDSEVRYSKLISLYNAQQNNLLNKIETAGWTRFNDTPQADPDTGFEGDDYTTTFTEHKNFSDATTVIARLEEVRKLWKNIYEEWQKEFNRKFIID